MDKTYARYIERTYARQMKELTQDLHKTVDKTYARRMKELTQDMVKRMVKENFARLTQDKCSIKLL